MDKYLQKCEECGVYDLTTRSQVIEKALVVYFNILADQNETLMKGDNKDEN